MVRRRGHPALAGTTVALLIVALVLWNGPLAPSPGAGTAAAAGPVDGGTLVVGSEGQHEPLEPGVLTGTVTLRITALIFENLVAQDLTNPRLKYVPLVPGLAESWTVSSDGKTYTFKTRKGVQFQDGTPLDAAAVKFNFDRAMLPSFPYYSARAKASLDFVVRWVDRTEAPDASTFVMYLKDPFPSLLDQLADRRMAIMSPDAIRKWGNAQIGAHPVGTGPFRFADKSVDNTITLERNPDYWGAKAHLAKIVFRPYTDPTALIAALQAGEIDAVMTLEGDQLAVLRKDPRIQLQYADLPNIFFWMLNARSGPTTNRLVRQALNYAINRDVITKNLLQGAARPALGPVPVGNPVYAPALEIYGYDPAKAKALLAQAHVPTPLTLHILLPTSGTGLTVAPEVAALMQGDLAKIGVTLTFERLEWAAFLAKAGLGLDNATAALYTGWSTGVEDPYWLERMFGSGSVPPGGINRSWYSNHAVDQLFAQASGEFNESKRIATYRRAAQLIAEDAPWIFLYQDRWPRAISARVHGFVGVPTPYVDMTKIWVQ